MRVKVGPATVAVERGDITNLEVDAIINARRIAAFGLGPSSAIASYLATQLNRFGLEAWTLSNTGLLFADDLQKLVA